MAGAAAVVGKLNVAEADASQVDVIGRVPHDSFAAHHPGTSVLRDGAERARSGLLVFVTFD